MPKTFVDNPCECQAFVQQITVGSVREPTICAFNGNDKMGFVETSKSCKLIRY